jgi:hypothetical protein
LLLRWFLLNPTVTYGANQHQAVYNHHCDQSAHGATPTPTALRNKHSEKPWQKAPAGNYRCVTSYGFAMRLQLWVKELKNDKPTKRSKRYDKHPFDTILHSI